MPNYGRKSSQRQTSLIQALHIWAHVAKSEFGKTFGKHAT